MQKSKQAKEEKESSTKDELDDELEGAKSIKKRTLELVGIDPTTCRMQIDRSAIWAIAPFCCCCWWTVVAVTCWRASRNRIIKLLWNLVVGGKLGSWEGLEIISEIWKFVANRLALSNKQINTKHDLPAFPTSSSYDFPNITFSRLLTSWSPHHSSRLDRAEPLPLSLRDLDIHQKISTHHGWIVQNLFPCLSEISTYIRKSDAEIFVQYPLHLLVTFYFTTWLKPVHPVHK